MLYVLFQLGNDRYALEASRVVEVVPLLALKKIPQSPRAVAGLMVYRGKPVPVLDLCQLTLDRPARELLSTRIVVINTSDDKEPLAPPAAGQAPPALLGLIAERATETLRRAPQDFVDSAPISRIASAPFLGPVLMDERGVVQLLYAHELFTGKLRELINPAAV